MKEVIRKISKLFNDNNIVWALGGSLVLKHYGLTTIANDIDILVSKESLRDAVRCMDLIGKGVRIPKDDFYKTNVLYRYLVDEVEVDIICGFKVLREELFVYDFDKHNIATIDSSPEGDVHYSSLEEWLLLYDVLGRDSKVELIKTYLEKNGFKHKDLLDELVLINKNVVSKELLLWLENFAK